MGFATHLGPWLLGTVRYTTGTTAGTVRNTGCTTVAQSGTMTKATTSATTLFALPAGSQVLNIYVDVTEAFNAGTGNTITIKAGATTLAVVGDATTTPIAAGRATITISNIATWTNVGTSDVLITATFAGVGTAATTGIATVTAEYVVRGDDGAQAQTGQQV